MRTVKVADAATVHEIEHDLREAQKQVDRLVVDNVLTGQRDAVVSALAIRVGKLEDDIEWARVKLEELEK